MTRRTVAVLMGGTSPEHGVSLKSGATMWRGLASAGHRVLAVVMSRDGLWNLLDASVLPEQLPVEAPALLLFRIDAATHSRSRRFSNPNPSTS